MPGTPPISFRSRTIEGREVSAIEDNGSYLEHLLVGGELDVAVMVISNLRDRMALQAEIIETSPYRLWLPIGHPLVSADIISVGDIAREPLIMLTVDEIEENTGKLLTALGARPHVAFRTRSVEAVTRSKPPSFIRATISSEVAAVFTVTLQLVSFSKSVTQS
ncbi:MAG: hypothetical protein J0I73_14375 [Sphingomonas sp.]|uniref:LysR substrate-binding domain-containing protein n=1 Tax=Sphingomonas sp. TaxID=28214 RepID=UPI001AC03B3E|nr:LysR substrate-binding domain-containing protein [Sphingomonas sp.]MBN8849263.1 hypothetical protein [Sphingomonas sp.]